MNLLLTGAFTYAEEQFNTLSCLGYEIYFLQKETDELPLPANEIDAVVCNGLFLHHNIDTFVRLRFIQLTSAGLDRIPIEKIQTRNIILRNARGVYSIPMAEWALFCVLKHYKQAGYFISSQVTRQWQKNRELREIVGTKVAIIGAGSVGQEVAKRFYALGANVVGFDIRVSKISYFLDMRLIQELERCIAEFDTIIVTAPLTEETHHLLSENILMQLKEHAVLVNIARGAIIDQEALYRTLLNRPDIHAALDVFENEPLSIESPLWEMSNVFISPHNSFVSDGNMERMFNVIYNNLADFIGQKS